MGFAGQHGPGAASSPDSLPADGAPYEEAGLGFDGPSVTASRGRTSSSSAGLPAHSQAHDLDLDPGLLEAQLRELPEARAHGSRSPPTRASGLGSCPADASWLAGSTSTGALTRAAGPPRGRPAGIPLAERDALLVTLEPCSSSARPPLHGGRHRGRTAPGRRGRHGPRSEPSRPGPRAPPWCWRRGGGAAGRQPAGADQPTLPALDLSGPDPQPTPLVVAKWAQTMTGQLFLRRRSGRDADQCPEALEEVQVPQPRRRHPHGLGHGPRGRSTADPAGSRQGAARSGGPGLGRRARHDLRTPPRRSSCRRPARTRPRPRAPLRAHGHRSGPEPRAGRLLQGAGGRDHDGRG